MHIFSIPGKLEVSWNPEVFAIIDTWTTYHISLEDFRNAVLVKGLDHAKANHGKAWIVDSSKAVGVFSPEIQAFIGSDIFPAFAKNGIKYFITINSEVSTLTKLTVNRYKAQVGPHGLQLVEVASVDDAILWLKENAA
ncbi:MAG: hypothetical protein IV090_21265 [Candidatus Sericytochromatia bacterium]|nr:hypothetical protein [Candidatus Sericytochromatia bacterium]